MSQKGMTVLEHVALRIKELRTGYPGGGLSQEALAKKLEVASNTVSRWETTTYKPSLEDLERIARFFQVSILEFFPAVEGQADESITALMRAAKGLPPNDIEELKRYAEFRRARHAFPTGGRKAPGRKAVVS